MLVFNTINGEDLQLKIEDVPVDWVITTDRKIFPTGDYSRFPPSHIALRARE